MRAPVATKRLSIAVADALAAARIAPQTAAVAVPASPRALLEKLPRIREQISFTFHVRLESLPAQT